MTDVGDEKQVKKAKRKAKSRKLVEREELRLLMQERSMRNFLWTLLEECGIYRTSFSGEMPYTSAFNEGMRDIGHKVIEMIDAADPHGYMKIYDENRKDRTNE